MMKLHIYNITEDDLGKYQCLAKNSQGETSGEIELYGRFNLENVASTALCHPQHIFFVLHHLNVF